MKDRGKDSVLEQVRKWCIGTKTRRRCAGLIFQLLFQKVSLFCISWLRFSADLFQWRTSRQNYVFMGVSFSLPTVGRDSFTILSVVFKILSGTHRVFRTQSPLHDALICWPQEDLVNSTWALSLYLNKCYYKGFPSGAAVKQSTCNAGDAGDIGLIPGSGRAPGGEHGNPLQYSCLENPMDRGAWWATVRGTAKSWTWLRDYHIYGC